MSLDYLIAEKNQIIVISFVGEMTKDQVVSIERCTGEITAKSFSFAVLNFRDTKEIDHDALRPLNLLQQSIRQKPAELRLCGLNPKMKEYLLVRGTIRDSETRDNLQEALKSMNQKISIINQGKKVDKG